MIVDPDFLTHWKTQALREALEDDAAPLYVIALWAHCQLRRTDRFEGIDHSTFAKICRYPFKGDSGAFFEAVQTCGFVDIEGDTVIVHGWAEVNSKLFSNWQNGKLGGRVGNPQRTQPEPKSAKSKLGTLDKIRKDKEREDKKGKIGEERKPAADAASVFDELSDDFKQSEPFRTAWTAFVDHRHKIRAKLTKDAIHLFALDFKRWGVGKSVQSMQDTIKSGKWTGLFEPKVIAGTAKSAGEFQRPRSVATFDPMKEAM